MKRVLITGKNSYIGTSVEKWLMRESGNFSVTSISVHGDEWKSYDFSKFDVVLHVAGIAHVSKKEKLRSLYFSVNRDLTIDIASKSKRDGVKQFIFMSSIIVFGKTNFVIDSNSIPVPDNFYGESKLQAERGIENLKSDDFRVSIVRPPMIYGFNSKGNYKKLSAFAKRFPFFPNYVNKRSVLYIGNLCCFLENLIQNNMQGLFYPQNAELVSTVSLFEEIAKIHGNVAYKIGIFNPVIKILSNFGVLNKMFGNLAIDPEMSKYSFDYQLYNLRESILLTEKGQQSL